MTTDLRAYLGHIRQQLRLNPSREAEILHELSTHVEDHVSELTRSGTPAGDALKLALRDLGNPSKVAREMYSVHSIGSWNEVLLAIMPHLLLAAVFALHLWMRMTWVVGVAMLAAAVAGLAWRMGTPKWSYSWLGYALAAPALTWLLALTSLAYGAWQLANGDTLPMGLPLYLGVSVYIPFSLWAMWRIARRVAHQDWLMVSLAALPLPFLASWLFFLHWRGGLLAKATGRAQQTDADTALAFIALAVTTALFLKVGRRGWRILLVLVAAPVLVAVAGLTYQADHGSLPIIAATSLTVAFLLSPLLLYSRAPSQEEWRYSPSAGPLT